MTDAARAFLSMAPAAGQAAVCWLGQSGYALKADDGTVIYIDAYLTDTISNGYRPYIHARLVKPVFECDDPVPIKALLFTHDHQDHMDPNSVVQLLWNTDANVLASRETCAKIADSMRVPADRLSTIAEGEKVSIGPFDITAAGANHSPGAVSFVVEVQGLTLFFSGDTHLFYTLRDLGEKYDLDYAFLCFNGQAGNMDIRGAVATARMLKPGCVIPSHYGMYADNDAQPDQFGFVLSQACPDTKYRILQPGKPILLEKQ